jgi:hypothetical protein
MEEAMLTSILGMLVVAALVGAIIVCLTPKNCE